MKTAKPPILALTFCLTAFAAGCSGAPPQPSATAAPVGTALAVSPATTPTTSTTATAPAPATESPAPTGPATTKTRIKPGKPAPGTASARPLDPPPPPTGPECEPAVLLPVARKLVNDPAAGLKVEKVEVPVCRNGYARVFTVPARTPQRFEGDQLFLRLVDGAWKLVERGASIDCGDEGLSPAVTEACTALA
ncbi:hypothetical protein [Actinoplanes sp. NPDC049802]|uniref:hypothetical protein n=1 Tax=Actinoplanes sp. NPDC049802 TaxID=3154742 RepID=UPI0033D28F20